MLIFSPGKELREIYHEINVDKDLASERSVYRFYQRLLSLRANQKALLPSACFSFQVFPSAINHHQYESATFSSTSPCHESASGKVAVCPSQSIRAQSRNIGRMNIS